MGKFTPSQIENFGTFLAGTFFLISIFTILFTVYYISAASRIIYATTNNLFVTISILAALIFLAIGTIQSSNKDKTYKIKNFLENGGLYFIISGILFIISFIIYLVSRKI